MQCLKILSFSGGGLLAKWTLYLMTKLEEDLNFSFKESFDVFAGISSGSIITGGFLINKTPFEVFKFFNEFQNIIFKNQLKWYKKSNYAFRGKYFHKSSVLSETLKKFVDKDLKFSDIKDNKGYFIGAVDIRNLKIKVFSQNISESFDTPNALVWEAILGSSCPPFYLGPIKTKDNQLLIDGGVSFVNPALEVTSSLLSSKKLKDYDYKLLSLSCPTFTLPDFHKMKGPKKTQYLLTLFKSTTDHDRAKIFCESILGKKNCLFVEPIFPDLVDFDWIVPNRFDKHFNYFYYLLRDNIRDFLINNNIIKNVPFKLEKNQLSEIDKIIEKSMIEWKKKEIKQDYSSFLERLL